MNAQIPTAAPPQPTGHGHSHGGEACHGHSEPKPEPVPTNHGHSHGGKACHGHDNQSESEEEEEPNHGHSHGGEPEEVPAPMHGISPI